MKGPPTHHKKKEFTRRQEKYGLTRKERMETNE